MPFKTHRLIPTTEKETEVLLEVLEIPLLQYAVTATTPGLHPPLETITEDLRNFGLVQISHKFEKSGKRSQTLQWSVKELQEGERCQTMYIWFWSDVSTTVMYSAMQSWYCFDWSWSRVSMPPGGIAGVCLVIFFVSAATRKKVKTKDSKQENIYSPLRHQSMKAWRDLSQKLSVTAILRLTNFAMVQKRDLKEEFAGNFAKQQKWLNNPTLNSATLRIWEEFQKRGKKV